MGNCKSSKNQKIIRKNEEIGDICISINQSIVTALGDDLPNLRLELFAIPDLSVDNPFYLEWPRKYLKAEEGKELTAQINEKIENYKKEAEMKANHSKQENGESKDINELLKPLKTELRDSLKKLILNKMMSRVGILNRKMQVIFEKAMKVQKKIHQMLEEFKAKAHQLIPQMKEYDIKRAASNIWPMLCFQAISNINLKITNSMIGFSMLYPLTDDIIDNQKISSEQKKSFIPRFSRLITHGDSNPENELEKEVWRMFHLIEKQWNRKKYAKTYHMMNQLFIAQIDSQRQFGGQALNKPIPDFQDIWDITLRKGSFSVLSDIYLVKKKIHPNEYSFAAHFGTVTQFLNDIKDVDNDFKEGQHTPFNYVAHVKKQKMDRIVDNFYHYIFLVFSNRNHIAGSHPIDKVPLERKIFFELMLVVLNFKILEGIAINMDKFSKEFLEKIEEKSSISLNLLKNVHDLSFLREEFS